MSDFEPPSKTEEPKQRLPKLAAEKALPKSSADTLVKIIKGYAVASNGGEAQINYKDVASAAGMSPTVVSGNNAFLLDSGILSSPKYGYYVPSESAVRFAREAAWDEAGAKSHLRRLVLTCWYGQVAFQNFTLRSTLTRADLKRALAIKCGATEGDSSSLEFLIDFIIYTGLVLENETGGLTKGNFDEVSREVQTTMAGGSERTPVQAEDTTNQTRTALPSAVSLILHLHVHDVNELTPEHANRVAAWLRNFSNTSSVDINVDSSEGTLDVGDSSEEKRI